MKLPNKTILLVLESWQAEALQGGNIDNIYTDIIDCIKSQESKLSLALEVIEKLKKSNDFYADLKSWSGEDSTGWEQTHCILPEDQEDVVGEWIEGEEDFYDNVGGKLARQTIKEVEELKKGLK